MKHLRSASLLVAFLPLLVFAAGNSTSPVPDAPVKKKESGFVFSLLPKSLQKNPRLDFNIITEVTPEGKKWPLPTNTEPIYYISQAGAKAYNVGIGAVHGLKTPPVEKLQQMIQKALAESNYLSSEGTTHSPSIAVIYQWGSHSFQPDEEITDDTGAVVNPPSELELRKAMLDRAMLLGGAKFAKEVAKAIEATDQKAMVDSSASAAIAASGGGDFMGSTAAGIRDPFDELRSRSPEMERLVDELFSSSFFVVASAYDLAALAKKERRLLWRTRMTVNAIGVNMVETIPPLIASAGPYFGRDMPDPVVLTKRISRDGKVEVGTPVVVPDSAPTV
jgi:hypothetical protein